MNKYYAMVLDFNSEKLKKTNIINDTIIEKVRVLIKSGKKYEEIKEEVNSYLWRRYMGRCEYELFVSDLCDRYQEKISVYDQVKDNIDVITKLIIEEANKHIRKGKLILEEY